MENKQTVITRIEAQKKRRDRVNIYLDGEFAFGLSHEVLVRFDIARGDQITPGRLAEIQAAEAVQSTKAKALALIGYRLRSIEEIRKRLTEKDFPGAAIDQAVEDLIRVGLLNDRQYAEAFIRTRMIQRPSGERLLRQELRQKGVGEADIDAALDSTLAELNIHDIVSELAAKRSRQLPADKLKARKRLSDFLLRRGFSWDVVKPVVDEIVVKIAD
ncbi:RecX family transcriptional regulator [bacterium]|nr:RecX family transcriptional regulator [bacterium]